MRPPPPKNISQAGALAKLVRLFLPAPKASLFQLAGVELHSQLPLTVLGGLTRQNRSYFHRLTFQGSPQEQAVGKMPLQTLLQSHPAAAGSLIIVETDEPRPQWTHGRGWFFIPGWVNGELRLPLPDRVLKSKSVGSDLRHARAAGFEIRVAHGTKLLREFYREMHEPFIRRVHGETSYFDPLASLRPHLHGYELLLAHKPGVVRAVAGQLVFYERSGPRLSAIGVRDGDRTHVRDGVVAALDHFACRHLAAKGFSRLHTGRSRPFIRDGVLQNKRKLGNTITGSFWHWFAPGFALKILNFTPATKSFLQHNPFIFQTGGELHGAVFTDAARPLSHETLAQFAKDFFYPGLDKLVIYCFQSGDGLPPEDLPAEFSGRILVRPASELV